MFTKTPVNSIEIPPEYRALCPEWHGGQSCLLYAIASTGGLTLGNRRPIGCDTEEKWYLQLWQELSADITYAMRDGFGHEDYDILVGFEEWSNKIVEQLAKEYDL